MGNFESSSQFPSREADDGDQNSDTARGKKTAEGGEAPLSVLKVGIAVAGIALLALGEWGLFAGIAFAVAMFLRLRGRGGMGNLDSSSQLPSREEDVGDQSSDTVRGKKAAPSSVLKVGIAVVGIALFALGEWGLLAGTALAAAIFLRRRRRGQMGNFESSPQFPSSEAENGDLSSDGARGKMAAEGGKGPSSVLKVVGKDGGGMRTMESMEGGSSRGGGVVGYTTEISRLCPNPEPYPYRPRDVNQPLRSRMIKIMTYNVWSREDVKVHERMKAIGHLIQLHSPDVIFFQEVTPNIYGIFQSSSWWNSYESSVSPDKATGRSPFCILLSKLHVREFISDPFKNSTMGKELCIAKIKTGMGKKLIAATTHLKSTTPSSMNTTERVTQAIVAVGFLSYPPNVVFGGDMNWDDTRDGPFPLLDGWVDAWAALRPTENGWTYDTKTNGMLLGKRTLQKRLDRFVCKLRDFRLVGVEMIGMEAVPRVSYSNQGKELPVYPSDHYGLLLTIGVK